jgi:hypothetical protein
MTGTLAHWLEQLLGVDTSASGEGTAWGLANRWNWAPWLLLVFAAAAAVLILALYWLESGSAGRVIRAVCAALRLSAIALVLFMIAEWMLTLHRTGLPYVALLIDDSASMGIADRYDDAKLRETIADRLKASGHATPSRFNLARTLVLEDKNRLLRYLSDHYKLRVYFVSDSARAISGDVSQIAEQLRQSEPQGETSRLGYGLRSMLNDLRGAPPAAVILLSDGVTTEGETLGEAASYARRKGVPLFTVGLGNESPAKDLALGDLLVDEVVFVDDVINFEFTLSGVGFDNRPVKLTLKEKSSTQPLVERTLNVPAGGRTEKLRIPYRPSKVGDYEFAVEVEQLPEEIRHDNNRLVQVVRVRDEPIRVLLVQERPSYEFRFLKEMLLRERTIRLHYVQQDADVEFVERNRTGEQVSLPVFPVRREDLFAYDVVLFGDVNPSVLGPGGMENLVAFVKERGGGVIFFAGPEYTPLAYQDTPLAELMPIDARSAALPGEDSLEQEFRVEPTELGLSKPQMQLGDSLAETAEIWRTLPGIRWLLDVQSLRPAAQVLAEHPARLTGDGRKMPVILYQIAGAGKVLFHGTDETHLWRARIGDKYFARYWVQAIRYLSRAKLLGDDKGARLVTDRTRYRRGEPVRFQLRFIDERLAPAGDRKATVLFERQGQTRRPVTLSRIAASSAIFEGQASKLTDGRYHAWVVDPALPGDPSADFEILPPAGETERSQMDLAELTRAASDTRGKFYRFANAHRLFDDLPEGRPVPIETLPPVPLWNKWPILLVFLCLLSCEWLLRKRKGML